MLRLGTALLKVMQRLKHQHPDMTVYQAQFFIMVAANPGINQKDLYTSLGSNDSVASRTLALLSDVGSRSVPGLNLVSAKINPLDRRERLLNLTPKGETLWADIRRDFGDE